MSDEKFAESYRYVTSVRYWENGHRRSYRRALAHDHNWRHCGEGRPVALAASKKGRRRAR